MDIIQLLPDSVANQIAAGEVIQRPASVIKELVENSIDAGAKNIQVLICDAGRTSIQVIDDGCGMSDTDARLCFDRHATSKIRKAADLFALTTMGFRGEALASIAAVAQVTLKTRTKDDELGTRIVISGSKFVEQEVEQCPVGTNFLIENLFFNVPARRKFLKSNSTEMNNITQAFERIALVYPEVNFTLYNNGIEMMQLRSGSLKQRIVDVFGKRLNQQLLPVETSVTLCDIKGFVGTPESAKKKGFHQFFFVNGRYMKHPYFHKAVQSAFDRLVPEGEQVSYFIYLTVDPQDIDVNIHPVKTEIKFSNEQDIWQILMAAVRDAVGRFTEVTSLDFDTEGKPDIPVFNPTYNPSIGSPKIDFNPQYNPFRDESDENNNSFAPKSSGRTAPSFSDFSRQTKSTSAPKGWEDLFGNASDGGHVHHTDLTGGEEVLPAGMAAIPEQGVQGGGIEPLASFNAQYIIAQSATGLILIDQNRASQRVLFERYLKELQTHTAHTQKVLFPEVVQFPPSYSSHLDAVLNELRSLGFEITDLGGNNFTIDGVPAGIGGLDPVNLVSDLVSMTIEHGTTATDEIHTVLALGLSKRAATPVGEILSMSDMQTLVKDLFACELQRYTPDGKPIICAFTNEEISRRF